MALEPITTDGPVIRVSNIEELKEAYAQLSTTSGGGTIELEPGDYGGFGQDGRGVDTEEPVIFKSVNPDDPASFTSIYLTSVSNARFENIEIDSTHLPDGEGRPLDLQVKGCDNIQIVDSTFTHDLDNSLKDSGEVVKSFSHIRESNEILFSGNYINGYMDGLQVTDTTNSEFSDNEVTNMQGDGFRGGGFQHVSIERNYMHDFYGADQNITHNDLIQIWGSNNDITTFDVTIADNILMASGAASQSIFIRNEEFGKAGDPTAGYFEDFTITGNVIYNAHKWGIHVSRVDGAYIANNTLLYNTEAQMILNGQPYTSEPQIYVRASQNITAVDNIAPDITLPSGSTESGNEIVQYTNPLLSNYVDKHFVNALEGVDATFEDLFLLPSSPWYGMTGSTLNSSLDDVIDGVLPVIAPSWDEDDRYELTFDASNSLDESGSTADNPGYTYHWTFDDGSTATGLTVTKVYESGGFKGVDLEIRLDGETVASVSRNYDVVTKDIFSINFEGGVVDLGDGAAEIIEKGTLSDSDDGQGYLIGDGNKLQIGRDTFQLFNLETFGLALDLEPVGDEQTGTFLELYGGMSGFINSEGYVGFNLKTDQGSYSLLSREPIFDDGEGHRIGLAFNGNTGQLEIFADGESVSSTEAWGATLSKSHYDLVFGRTFKDSMDGVIDNIIMSIDPAVAGDLADIAPPDDQPMGNLPADDPPADDPPVVSPTADDPPADDPPVVSPTADDPPADDPPVVNPTADEPRAEDPPADDPPAVGPTVDEPRAEDPPADDPPAEDPPAARPTVEDPPAAGPTVEDPPAGDLSGSGPERGAPPGEIAATESNSFLGKIFDKLMEFFGLGRGKGAVAKASAEAHVLDETSLGDIVPTTCMLDETTCLGADEEEDDEFDIAA